MTNATLNLIYDDELDQAENHEAMQLGMPTTLASINELTIKIKFQMNAEYIFEDLENREGFDFASLINSVLREHGENITTLNLKFAFVGLQDHGTIANAISLLEVQHLPQLSQLTINFDCLSHEELSADENYQIFKAILRLLNNLPHPEQLSALQLGIQNIPVKGTTQDMADFHHFFSRANQLETFELLGMNYQDAGATDLMQIFVQHQNLKNITIDAIGSKLDWEHLIMLLQSQSIQKINWTTFDLIHQETPAAFLTVVQQFADALEENSTLSELHIHFDDFDLTPELNMIEDPHFFDTFYDHLSRGIMGASNLTSFEMAYILEFKFPMILKPYLMDIGQYLNLTHLSFPKSGIPAVINGLPTTLSGLQRVAREIQTSVLTLIDNPRIMETAIRPPSIV